jgi:hypothetical protein
MNIDIDLEPVGSAPVLGARVVRRELPEFGNIGFFGGVEHCLYLRVQRHR